MTTGALAFFVLCSILLLALLAFAIHGIKTLLDVLKERDDANRIELRDDIAMRALAGYCANPSPRGVTFIEVMRSYELADKMILERDGLLAGSDLIAPPPKENPPVRGYTTGADEPAS